MSKLSEYLDKNPGAKAAAAAVVGSLLAKAKQFASDWFSNFRVKEFAAVTGGSYVAGQALAAQVHVPAQAHGYVASAMAIVAAACYIRNPKHADWVTAPTGTAPDPNADADPLDESRDKDSAAH